MLVNVLLCLGKPVAVDTTVALLVVLLGIVSLAAVVFVWIGWVAVVSAYYPTAVAILFVVDFFYMWTVSGAAFANKRDFWGGNITKRSPAPAHVNYPGLKAGAYSSELSR